MSTLPVRTSLVVRDLPSGDVLVMPVGDPSLASCAESEEAMLEQRVFLTDYLARERPEVIARFSLPADVQLKTIDVLLAREGLPRRFAQEIPISFSAVLLPAMPLDPYSPPSLPDQWVHVIGLEHTFYVRGDEDLDVSLAKEIKRIIQARSLSSYEWLDLLPGDGDEIVSIELDIDRGSQGPAGRAGSLRKQLADHARKKMAVEVLEAVATRMHGASRMPPRPLLHRESELRTLGSLLTSASRSSLLLVGGDRVGKTALLRAWIEREEAAGNKPIVYATSGAQLVAGMSGLGQWQERVRRVLQAAEDLDAILFFDDLGDLFTDRGTALVDIPSAMKPWLEEGKVRVVGEIRDQRLDAIESRHVGFFSAFSRIRLPALNAKQSTDIAQAFVTFHGQYAPHTPQLAADAIQPLVDLAERYLPYQSFPGKVVQLYEEIRSRSAFANSHKPTTGEPQKLGRDAVYAAFSLRTGVPTMLLRDDVALNRADVLGFLHSRLIGQHPAVLRVAETLSVVKAGLQPANKPLATFLFVGPTGVGKTELARALSQFLFGSEDRLTRFDMSEFMDGYAADRLIRGHSSGEGLLTRKVREQPFSVLLLDEIEKAHPAVFDLLLQVLGEGRLTDARGRTAFFHNTIVILTSNLGAAHRKASFGFRGAAADDATVTAQLDQAHYERIVHSTFRPEFVNRLDQIVAFSALSSAEIQAVCRIAIDKIRARRGLADAGLELEVSEQALASLAEGGFNPAYGARALRRHLDDTLVSPIANLISGFGAPALMRVVVKTLLEVETESATDDPNELACHVGEFLRIALVKKAATRKDREQLGMSEISHLRRTMEQHLCLPSIAQLREQSEVLVAQLNYGQEKKKKKPKRSGAEIVRMQSDLHSFQEALEALRDVHGDVLAIEELGIAAFFEGSSLNTFVEECRRAEERWTPRLVHALLAAEPRRDACSLLLQELDELRALDTWLLPLLSNRNNSRGLTFLFHVAGEANKSDGTTWLTTRRYGPLRDAAYVVKLLESASREALAMTMTVTGPNAVLFALEVGLHRYRAERAHLLVRPLGLRRTLLPEVFDGTVLDPKLPTEFHELKKQPAIRQHFGQELIIDFAQERRVLRLPIEDYWKRYDEIALLHLLIGEEGAFVRGEVLGNSLIVEIDDILELWRGGERLAAITRYRERMGATLIDAKRILEERGGS